MNDIAAHLIDKVLPQVSYRQVVLSFPYKLRYLMAYNPKLTNKILGIFIQAITSHIKKQTRKFGFKNSKPGVITFIQRFGSALNLNVHFHSLVADGFFYQAQGEWKFYRLPMPSQGDLESIAVKIKYRVEKLIEKLGFNNNDQAEFDADLLSEISKISISHRSGLGDRAGGGLRRYGTKKIGIDPEGFDPFTVNVAGFSLNASVCISDRKKLEHLIRYMARGPIASGRLKESFPSSLNYELKTSWRDGTTHIKFSPLDFIARLVALIPPPRFNMIRYHGVFAPNFKGRKKIVPAKQQVNLANKDMCHTDLTLSAIRERMRWSEMLKRVFEMDVTVCPICKGRLEQIAVIKDRVVLKALLESLQEVTVFNPLKLEVPRGPPQFDEYAQEYFEF